MLSRSLFDSGHGDGGKYFLAFRNVRKFVEGYRGEIKVALINLGVRSQIVNRGDRIAQMIICPIVRADFHIVQKLDDTERGEGGFGSTGV